MNLKEFLQLIPEQCAVQLVCGACKLLGSAESVSCFLSDELLKYQVMSIESRENTTWIWIDEPED